jgi:LuxR family maltose regulon positive regulatory protein
VLSALQSPQPPPPQSVVTPLIDEIATYPGSIILVLDDYHTNREIASRLFLSLNTVKAHARNIYGKLGAHNRTQAITTTRALGILSSS